MKRLIFLAIPWVVWAPVVAQTALPGHRLNLDIVESPDSMVMAGETLSFRVVTRFEGDGDFALSLGDLSYTVEVGSLVTISFGGIAADGTIGLVSFSNGLGSVAMVDAGDADNEFLGSSSGGDPGRLNAGGDGLDAAVPAGESWDADWVFQVHYQLPMDVEPGSYEFSGSESGTLFVNDLALGPVTSGFPDEPNNRMPRSVMVVPEPSTALLALLGGLLVWRRRR